MIPEKTRCLRMPMRLRLRLLPRTAFHAVAMVLCVLFADGMTSPTLSAAGADASGAGGLRIHWADNMLSVTDPDVPGASIRIWYLEAFCRPGSTDRDWRETTMPHRTELVSASEDGKRIRLRTRVEPDVIIDHQLTAGTDEVEFELRATNRGREPSEVDWFQPCIRVGEFTGRNQDTYVDRCFIFTDNGLTTLDKTRRTEEARYRGGQVYVPHNVPLTDVNPRPISLDKPVNGLIGCFSADNQRILATAWDSTQELFQGVIVCIHNDPRIGGLRPGETKELRGKLYVVANDPEALLARYRRDFAPPGDTEHDSPTARIQREPFGRLSDGSPIHRYTLANDRGMIARISSFGAILTELHVPDASGRTDNVVHGFDNLRDYVEGHPAFGSTIGRVTNRIRDARFKLDGHEIRVTANAGNHHIHGGKTGFHKVPWKSRALPIGKDRAVAVELTYRSVNGEEGYPGNLDVNVTYTLTDDNALVIDYTASTDAPTPINLTNHTYFNLNGAGDILDHVLLLAAPLYTGADSALIPTGEILKVSGTGLDFTKPTRIGDRIAQFKPRPGGYDHNYVLNPYAFPPTEIDGTPIPFAARVSDPASGRQMEVFTTEPAVQLYTANWTGERFKGPGGRPYGPHSGFCLETQHFPDSVNHPHFPSTILRPGEVFRSTTLFRFLAE